MVKLLFQFNKKKKDDFMPEDSPTLYVLSFRKNKITNIFYQKGEELKWIKWL